MKKATLGLFSAILFLSLSVAQPVAAQKAEAPLFGADRALLISPQTILLDEARALGVVEVTIHADVLYNLIDLEDDDLDATVVLGTVEASSIFADNRGELVARFDWAAVAGLVAGEGEDLVTLTLTCTSDGIVIFEEDDDVRVVF